MNKQLKDNQTTAPSYTSLVIERVNNGKIIVGTHIDGSKDYWVVQETNLPLISDLLKHLVLAGNPPPIEPQVTPLPDEVVGEDISWT